MKRQLLNNSKILIVDDARPPRKVLRKLLNDFGEFKIVEAETSKEAINLLSNQDFTLVFCDHHLLGSNSFVVLDWIAKNNTSIPVIVTSSDLKKETVLKGKKLGAVNFLVKPFNIGDLSVILSNVFELNGNVKKVFDLQ